MVVELELVLLLLLLHTAVRSADNVILWWLEKQVSHHIYYVAEVVVYVLHFVVMAS